MGFLRHAVVVAVGVAAAACGSFGGSGAVDAGADAEVPAPVADGAPIDAAVPPGADAAASCTADLCEDFESGDWPARWPYSGGPIEAIKGDATSGQLSILVKRNLSDGPRLIANELRPGNVVRLSVRIKVVTAGDGEMNLIGIGDATSPLAGAGRGVVITRPTGQTGYFVQAPGFGPLPLTASFAEWTPVTLELDLTKRVFSCSAGSKPVTGKVDPTWAPPQLYALLGAFFAPTVATSWSVRFDDAEITVLK